MVEGSIKVYAFKHTESSPDCSSLRVSKPRNKCKPEDVIKGVQGALGLFLRRNIGPDIPANLRAQS